MAETNTVKPGQATGKQSSNPFGKAIQGIAATIGLASESIQYHKQKRASQHPQRDRIPRNLSNEDCITTTNAFHIFPSPTDGEVQQKLPVQVDEVAWVLDEVQDDIIGTNVGKTTPPNRSPLGSPTLEEGFLQSHPPAESPTASGRLELPVVITQRRPKARTRGFIRAYAPVLQSVGIDQQTFLDFIDQLNKAVEPSPWITAIDLASLAGHAFPEPIHLLISASALMATQVTAEAVSRSKCNAFLDNMNQEFFKPKGLIALIVTWKPKKEGSKQNTTGIIDIDMSAVAASKKPGEDAAPGMKRRKSMIQKPSAGEMFELPEFAPLVFPELDAPPRSPKSTSVDSIKDKPLTGETDNKVTRETGHQELSNSARARSKSTGDSGIAQRAEMGCLPSFRHNTVEYVGPAVRQVKLGGKSAGSSVKRTGHFISDYQDRRAVARWSGQHPDSQMAKLAPTPGFQSRFADPNHPASSGDFVALVTGGKRTTAEVSREAVRATAAAGREGMMRVKSTTERAGILRAPSADGGEDGGTPRRIISPRARETLGEMRPRGDWLPRLPNTATAGVRPKLRRIGSLPLGAPIRTMKKLLQPDILYLMIVNLPTEEEIASAAACLNQANKETQAEDKRVGNSFGIHD